MTQDTASWSTPGPILSVQFIGTLGLSIAMPFLVFLVTDLGGAAWTYGVLGATYSAFQLVGAPALGRLSDWMSGRPALRLARGSVRYSWRPALG